MLRTLLSTSLALWCVACGDAPACPEATQATLDACATSCEAGDAEACARIGVAYEAGRLGQRGPDAVSAARYFGQACAHAPEEARWLCVLGPSVAEDGRPSAPELQRLCREGVILACHELGRTFVAADAVPVDLPGAEGEPEPAPRVAVRIGADGSLSLDGEATTLEAVRAIEPPRGARAIIAADARTPHARLVEVIDALRAAGVDRYAIAVEPGVDPPAQGNSGE